MRSFFLTLLLLAVMLAVIGANFIFINRLGDQLTARVNALPAQTGDTAAAKEIMSLEKDWIDVHHLVSFSVSFKELNRVTEQVTALRVWYLAGEDAEYQNARAQLLLAIEEMRRLERFSMDNIF